MGDGAPRAAALVRLKEGRRAAAPPPPQRGPEQQEQQQARPQQQRAALSAAASHAANDAYLVRFEQAFASLSAGGGGSPQSPQSPERAPAAAAAGRLRAGGAPAAARSKAAAPPPPQQQQRRQQQLAQEQPLAPAQPAPQLQLQRLAPGWRGGPADAAGARVRLSERPLLCSAALWRRDGGCEVVVGGADHALYGVDAQSTTRRRTLYSKTAGHSEWVTCACALPGGRLLSGGMDGRLWLWPAAGAAGSELRGAHAGPVAKVACLAPPPRGLEQPGGAAAAPPRGAAQLAASCSYDKTVALWDVGGARPPRGAAAVLRGHGAPVLELAAAPGGGALASGDRGGGLIAWDAAACAPSCGGAAGAHGPLLLSGGQDGCVRAWDARCGGGAAAATAPAHAGASGRGAVGAIAADPDATGGPVVSAGADCSLAVLDPAAGYAARAHVPLPDFPYALAAVGGLALAGCGDGSVVVIDVAAGAALHTLRAGRAAEQLPGTVANAAAAAGGSPPGGGESGGAALEPAAAPLGWPKLPLFADPWVQQNVALVYAHELRDGVGAQALRMLEIYAVARALGLRHVHRPLTCVGHVGGQVHFRSADCAFDAAAPEARLLGKLRRLLALPSDLTEGAVAAWERRHVPKLGWFTLVDLVTGAAAARTPLLISTEFATSIVHRFPDMLLAPEQLRPTAPDSKLVCRRPDSLAPPELGRPWLLHGLRVAVHLRRGDVAASPRWAKRLLPPSYYVNVVRSVMQELDEAGCVFSVEVYTEAPGSAEGAAELAALGAALAAPVVLPSADLAWSWQQMATADVLVMSNSAFSLSAALLNPNAFHVYFPNAEPQQFRIPLRTWARARDAGGALPAPALDELRRRLRGLRPPGGAGAMGQPHLDEVLAANATAEAPPEPAMSSPAGKRRAGPTTRARAVALAAACEASGGDEAAPSPPELSEPLVLHVLSFLPPALQAWTARQVCKAAHERFRGARRVSLRCPELSLAAVQEAWRAVQGDRWGQQEQQRRLAGARAACGDVPGLAWLRGAGCEIDSDVCSAAAGHGQLAVLEWARGEGLDLRFVCCTAARAGHLTVLEWARGKRLSLRDVCSSAAEGGQMAVLRWARAQTPPLPWGGDVCTIAAQHSDLEMLRWLRAQDKPAPWDEDTCWAAAHSGQLEALRWLRANGCPWWRAECERWAEAEGHEAVAAWMRAQPA
ncbi:HET-E1 [Scenedesmus sp. PABB004]|nr:HET-E1 [Scenedesmus sp. PABB004]